MVFLQIRLAVPSDVPALRTLFGVCFGDDETYVSRFYEMLFPHIYVPVAEDESGALAGMLHLLPCVYRRAAGGGKRGFYVYAVGVQPALRGGDVMRTLLSEVMRVCRDKDIFLVLMPANERLADYYRSYGFDYTFYRERMTCRFSPSEAQSIISWRVCDGAHYAELRTRLLAKTTHIAFGREVIDYALKENASFGGFSLLSSRGDLVFGLAEKGRLVLREALFCGDCMEALSSLAALYGASTAEVYTPHLLAGTVRTDTAMTYALDGEGYMNILLD